MQLFPRLLFSHCIGDYIPTSDEASGVANGTDNVIEQAAERCRCRK
jgi:hypothetical protein